MTRLILCLLGLLLLPAAALAEKLALVVGMGAYAHIRPLANSVNDARGIADTLSQAGFEVTLMTDVPLAEVQHV